MLGMNLLTLATGDVGKKVGFDMSDGWGAVIASVATGVFLLVAAFWAYKAGRRQVADQAAVEHEQWLRGQRQEAYLAFLASLDRLARDAEEGCDNLEDYLPGSGEEPIEPAAGLTIEDLEEEAREPFGMELYEELEKLTLLGPDAVVDAARAAAGALVDLGNAIRDGYRVSRGRLAVAEWGGYRGLALVARDMRDQYVGVVRRQLRSPARPEKRRW